MRAKPIVLVDRDGTLIREAGYPKDPDRVRLLGGAIEGLRALRGAGYPVVVVSNQSGVGRGLITPPQMHAVRRRFLALLRERGVRLNGYYWCPHAPEVRCACRKPALGMVRRAARKLGRSWRKAISIGDRPADVQLGQRTGGQGVLVCTGYGRRWRRCDGTVRPDYVARNFLAAARWILKKERMLTR